MASIVTLWRARGKRDCIIKGSRGGHRLLHVLYSATHSFQTRSRARQPHLQRKHDTQTEQSREGESRAAKVSV